MEHDFLIRQAAHHEVPIFHVTGHYGDFPPDILGKKLQVAPMGAGTIADHCRDLSAFSDKLVYKMAADKAARSRYKDFFTFEHLTSLKEYALENTKLTKSKKSGNIIWFFDIHCGNILIHFPPEKDNLSRPHFQADRLKRVIRRLNNAKKFATITQKMQLPNRNKKGKIFWKNFPDTSLFTFLALFDWSFPKQGIIQHADFMLFFVLKICVHNLSIVIIHS
jgi:hypothetical protein